MADIIPAARVTARMLSASIAGMIVSISFCEKLILKSPGIRVCCDVCPAESIEEISRNVRYDVLLGEHHVGLTLRVASFRAYQHARPCMWVA